MDSLSGMQRLKQLSYRTLDIGDENYEQAAVDMLNTSHTITSLKLSFLRYTYGHFRMPLLWEGEFAVVRDTCTGGVLSMICKDKHVNVKQRSWKAVLLSEVVQIFTNWTDLRIATLRIFILQLSALLVMLAITLHRTALVISLLFQQREQNSKIMWESNTVPTNQLEDN
jgi:hypothetical protein